MSITIAQAFSQWESEIKPSVIAQYGADDECALSESWNDYTDYLCKDGDLNDLQYHYCPAWDESMPEDDAEEELQWLLEQMGVTVNFVQVAHRPDGLGVLGPGASHWRVTITRQAIDFEVYYSMGSAHKGLPKELDIISCVLRDSQYTDQSFEDWAGMHGYDSDSRKAEQIYNACVNTATQLETLFSKDELATLTEMANEL